MKMNRALTAGAGVIAGLLLYVNASAQDSEPNKWAPANIKIDGQATEWPKPLQFYNNVTKLFYTIANDQENLYVIVSVPDPQSQMKIMRSGLTVSINATGKKKGGAGITFPLTYNINTGAPDVPEESRALIAGELKKQLLANVKEIKVEGFDSIPDGNIPVKNTFGIQTTSSYDAAGNLVCELGIPLKVLGIPAGSDKPIAYHFKVNAMKREDKKELEAKRAKGEKPPMPGEYADNFALYYSADFWTRQTLATQK
ncbi:MULTISPECIES: hypothetical protein [Chitinophaga]|jgi:hypothetical protein|uniref:hypothetical protein n=1 Tax=Chitinophaga TaxID=79328 RepID=UPI000DB9AF8B|nr:hypothetical protein [Chitinophaga ginsengisegetis]MDR6567662.1 hypothetical protein [Chitinophaga ginsengisegetis]MDR6647783.1 hypothetical protein [Chitinophaga ginsengisegetis]MDR6654133.1 hypothetical protein [Chitinophaga ginsengisegetis]